MSANHPTFAVIDGALYNKSQKKLIWGKEGATIPEGIKIIGDYACYEVPNCGINENGIVLPSTIEEIGDYAFYGNKYSIKYSRALSLFRTTVPKSNYPYLDLNVDPAKLIWGSNLQKIGSYAFANITIKTVFSTLILPIPSSVSEIGKGCFSEFGVQAYQHTNVVILIPKDSRLRSIPTKAFFNHLGTPPICLIICEAPIVTIGDYAFYGTDIANFNMQNVKTLGKGAFMETTQRSGITIPACLKVIPEDAFKNARTFEHDIVISNGVEVIEANALDVNPTNSKGNVFSLSPIRLPTSLTSIAPDAFRDDTEFIVERGSYAYRWAEENARNYSIDGEKQNLDWLNN